MDLSHMVETFTLSTISHYCSNLDNIISPVDQHHGMGSILGL